MITHAIRARLPPLSMITQTTGTIKTNKFYNV
jgi:hypothetical protein